MPKTVLCAHCGRFIDHRRTRRSASLSQMRNLWHIRHKMLRRAGIWYNSRKIEGAIWKRN